MPGKKGDSWLCVSFNIPQVHKFIIYSKQEEACLVILSQKIKLKLCNLKIIECYIT